jgi:hypothetical protein
MAGNRGVNANLVLVAGLAAGAYLLYRFLSGAASRAVTATEKAFSDTSSSVADVAERLIPFSIGNRVLVPGASIVLGDGTEIPASAPKGVGAFTDSDGVVKFQFYYQGRTYRTDAGVPDDTGTYYAAAVSG